MLLVYRHVTVYKKRRVGKVRGKALVGLRGLGEIAHYRRKRGVNLALGVGLRCRLAGVLQSVGPGEMAIQVIEATVLQVDDHNVLDPFRPPSLRTCRPRPLVYSGQESKTQHRTNEVPSLSYFRFHLGSLAGALVGAGALGNGSDRCGRTDRRLRMIYTGAIWCRMHNPPDCLCRSELSNEHGPETPASIRRRAAETIDIRGLASYPLHRCGNNSDSVSNRVAHGRKRWSAGSPKPRRRSRTRKT